MLQIKDLMQIDTRQGTDNQATYSNGNCLPYMGVPFGMNHFVVQTADTRGSWFFNPNDRTFQGIRLTHQPSPWMGDFSQLLLSPVAGSHCQPELAMAQSSYRSDEAVFAPHYVKVKQERYRILTEVTPTTYGAVMRNQYQTAQPKLVLRTPGEGTIKIDEATGLVSGYVINAAGCEDKQMKLYFAMQFSQTFDFAQCGYFEGSEFINSQDVHQSDAVFVLAFNTAREITTHLATSFLSPEQAQLNLSRILSDDFDDTKAKAAKKWLSYLNKIEIESKNKQQVATFYGCMYRTCLFPQKMYELNVNGQPEHYNTLSKEVNEGYLYTNNGFWDTYKTVYPLFSLIAQTEYAEMLSAYLQSYREAGYLPKWLSPDERGMMPGTLIDAVVADAAVKHIGLELMPDFLEAMVHGATTCSDKENYGRRGTLDYLKLGYVPSHYGESVNHTLDYAYSDFCIAQVANILGKDKLTQSYQRQANNFLNVFDKGTGFMRAKSSDGQFRADFSAERWGTDYAEGSAWQSSFATYHNFKALIKAHGGEAVFYEKLTALCNQHPYYEVGGYGFEIHEMSEMAAVDFGQVALSNQPSFHLPYLFNYVGKPASTQVLVKQLMTRLFHTGWDGYPGDEDNGSMSGWYLFSSLGFYPVCPGSGEYVIGIPLFDCVTIHLSNGETLTITTEGNQPQANFVSGIHLNQQPHDRLFFTHDELMTGANIQFTLGIVPTEREYNENQIPFSMSFPQA